MLKKKPTFSILKKIRGTDARLGVLRTPYGTIKTPAYVIVATHAAVRTLRPPDIKKTKTQMVIANAYHLWGQKNVHKKLGTRMPMMTDSGGFQVFSLGAAKDHRVGKVLKRGLRVREEGESNVKITERGAHFMIDGKKRFISPELSIAAQEQLGADIIFAFDECTSPLHPFAYQKKSMERTHRWAQRCLKAHTKKNQMLFGIVQGGRFKSLRTQSARVLAEMSFDGYGIGGSFGEDGMATTLSWITPYLPEGKPRHLLGIGSVRDVFTAVEAGMDTFDCVIPTREARHGRIYTDAGPVNIKKTKFRGNPRAATIHNVQWFNALLKNIRTALMDGSYNRFKKKFLKKFTGSSTPLA